MNRICVYCGSSIGIRPEYSEVSRLLGKSLAKNNIELVYGGSKIGLMGEVSNEVLKNNGKAIGVMPKGLFSIETASENLTKFIEVETMHERKQTMCDLSDGFIALPGGLGTFEELFEMLSWARIGIHQKPIGLLNICNFFDPLINMLKNTCNEGFMKKSNMDLFCVSENPLELIQKMNIYVPTAMETRWRKLG